MLIKPPLTCWDLEPPPYIYIYILYIYNCVDICIYIYVHIYIYILNSSFIHFIECFTAFSYRSCILQIGHPLGPHGRGARCYWPPLIVTPRCPPSPAGSPELLGSIEWRHFMGYHGMFNGIFHGMFNGI